MGWSVIRLMNLMLRQGRHLAPAPQGRVEVISRDELICCSRWKVSFDGERKDHRYYEIVEDTILQGFEYKYFVIKDANKNVCAVQPFFIVDQDLLGGVRSKITGLVELFRRIWHKLYANAHADGRVRRWRRSSR